MAVAAHGYDLSLGWLAGGMMAWRISGRDVDMTTQWTVHELKQQLAESDGLKLIDARQPAEWSDGHIPQAIHISGGELLRRLDKLNRTIPRNKPVAFICGSGYRSSVPISLVQRSGYEHVFNVHGGMAGWENARCETTSGRECFLHGGILIPLPEDFSIGDDFLEIW
jgi:hydroxyacylglutathione hydrolase